MPTYLCHGFRWHRPSIRVYVVVQNIDDAAPEWIISPASSAAILQSFYTNFDFLPEARAADDEGRQPRKKPFAPATAPAAAPAPDPLAKPPPPVPPEEDDVLLNAWSAVKLLEEYDPTDLTSVSRPYAFVADHVVRVDLSASVAEEMAGYEARMARDAAADRAMAAASSDDFHNGKAAAARRKGGGSGRKAGWLEKLRDQLQRGEDIRWYVVVCGDEERAVCEAPPEPPREALEPRHVAEMIRQEPAAQEPVMRSFEAPRAETARQSSGKTSTDGPREGEARPRTGRERSASASKRVTGGYSPFPPPASAAPPSHRRMPSLGAPRPPTGEGGPPAAPPQPQPQFLPGALPQMLLDPNAGAKAPHKSRSLRRLFGRKEGPS